VGYLIESEKKDQLAAYARAAGVTASSFLEHVIDHLADELDEDGVPNWWPQPDPQELPLAK
jgi:hypothetical protein